MEGLAIVKPNVLASVPMLFNKYVRSVVACVCVYVCMHVCVCVYVCVCA